MRLQNQMSEERCLTGYNNQDNGNGNVNPNSSQGGMEALNSAPHRQKIVSMNTSEAGNERLNSAGD